MFTEQCRECGVEFTSSDPRRRHCTKACKTIRDRRRIADRRAQIAETALSQPQYTIAELREAKHHISLYGDDPKLARGREFLLIKAHQIVDYFRARQEAEYLFARRRQQGLERTKRYQQRKKKNDTSKQPVS
jgi:hypothetical protein